ncbi:hypothetical protein [Euzebya tangerina]|uniref:hypothetical protein n=1 Tax=Euzebya tangerina TaxID=591198 RepID=UPI000E3114C5|nr:hypothetical protein [Euzebya tangerina]
MAVVGNLLAGIGFVWLLVVVHEYGHVFAGRSLGVPADHIRVELSSPPAHVALRDGDTWLSPDEPGYQAAFQRFNPSGDAAWLYVAAGLGAETVLAVAAAASLIAVGLDGASTTLLIASLLLGAGYLLVDVLGTARAGRPTGDHSAMWAMRRLPTAALVLVSLCLKIIGVSWASQ